MGGRAAELTAAVDRLELLATENLSVAAAFDLSYADLAPEQQRLFRRLGLHPGTDIDPYAAAALDGTGQAAARRGLDALYEQYLLTEPAPGRYRMHDLIREHARVLADRLDPGDDREQATGWLLDYYQHAAARAQDLLARQTRGVPAEAADAAPANIPALADREQALAWARAERTSLLTCLDQVTAAGQHARRHRADRRPGRACWATTARGTEAITRHATAVQAARQLGDRAPAAATRPQQPGAIAPRGTEPGTTPGAARDLQEALAHLLADLGDRPGQAHRPHPPGSDLAVAGSLPSGSGSACGMARPRGRRRRGLLPGHPTGPGPARHGHLPGPAATGCGQANRTLYGLARSTLRRHRRGGTIPGALGDLRESVGICQDLGDRRGQATTLIGLGGGAAADWGLSGCGQGPAGGSGHLLRPRRPARPGQRPRRPRERGASDRGAPSARPGICRRDWASSGTWATGRARRRPDQPGEGGACDRGLSGAARDLQEALDISREIGSPDTEVTALNESGTLSRICGDLGQARSCHQQALDLARQLGIPLEEAHALAGLGRCARAAGRTAEAEDKLRQALAIFQRIGAAEAADVSAELDALPGTPDPASASP